MWSVSVLEKDASLTSAVNSRARKITLRGKHTIVPLLFDEEGEPATVDTLILKRLTILDLRFLKAWKECAWNVEKACEMAGVTRDKASSLIRRLQVFREEDAKVKALAEIPTPTWIKAKHVENIYSGGTLEDSQQKSLSELAKIEGAYKNQATVNLTQNVFNLPKLTPEVEAEFRQLAEKAIETEAA